MSKRRATGNPFAISGVNNRLTVSQPSIESAGGRLRDAREAQEITENADLKNLLLRTVLQQTWGGRSLWLSAHLVAP